MNATMVKCYLTTEMVVVSQHVVQLKDHIRGCSFLEHLGHEM